MLSVLAQRIAAWPLDVQDDRFTLEISAKEAPGRCFVRETRDFATEIALT